MNAQFEAIIKQHLDARAAEDPQFAEKYGNPNKSVTECCKYIVGEASAKSNGGMAAIPDAEVYGLAVHYYDEENITIRECGGLRDVTPPAPLTDEQKVEAETATSLLLSARDKDGRRLETIEFSLTSGEVLQSRAACNQTSQYHQQILSMMADAAPRLLAARRSTPKPEQKNFV